MKKTICILGTGPGIRFFSNQVKRFTEIGVNDIYKHYKADYLLLMDKPAAFTVDRLDTILHSKPKVLFTSRTEWLKPFNPSQNICLFNIGEPACNLSYLDSADTYPHHCDSTYTSVCIAVKMEATEIIMYGCDFIGHKFLSPYHEAILEAYSNLRFELNKRGIELKVYNSTSILSKVLPFIHVEV